HPLRGRRGAGEACRRLRGRGEEAGGPGVDATMSKAGRPKAEHKAEKKAAPEKKGDGRHEEDVAGADAADEAPDKGTGAPSLTNGTTRFPVDGDDPERLPLAPGVKYRRILLKLSGEALMGPGEYGIDP